MAITNSGDAIGITINYLTTNITGSEYLTLLTIAIILILLGMVFKMPFNLISLIVLPVILIFAAYTTAFVPVLLLVTLYLALQITLAIMGK